MSRSSELAVRAIGRAKTAEEAKSIGEAYAIMEEVCRQRPELYDEIFPPSCSAQLAALIRRLFWWVPK